MLKRTKDAVKGRFFIEWEGSIRIENTLDRKQI